MKPLRKILMPTPLVYAPPPDRFLIRDAARFSRAFQAMGIDCKKLVIGDPKQHTVTAPELKLAEWKHWIDPEWWKSEACDLVLFYGHVSPKVLPVLKAIKSSNALLILKMDSGLGAPGFWLRPRIAAYSRYWFLRDRGNSPFSAIINCLTYAGLEATPLRRSDRLLPLVDLADMIALETPEAVKYFRKWCAARHRAKKVNDVVKLEHPVETTFCYTTSDPAKLEKIIAVGRWRSFQKDGPLLAQTLALTLKQHTNYSAVIIGENSDWVKGLISQVQPQVLNRIRALPNILNKQVREEMLTSNINLVTSRYESFNIAAAEALCCGCSIVATPECLPAQYFISYASGSIAKNRSPKKVSEALRHEIDKWDAAERNPIGISKNWSTRLHINNLCNQLCNFTNLNLIPDPR